MGPLNGTKIVELAGIGPGPMCAMLLAELGATVLRIERPGPADLGFKRPPRFDLLLRGRQSIRLDLKRPDAVALVLDLVEKADALIEGFRPGVTERLGLSPDVCLARNQRLVYGRMTGWGQDGPLAQAAGHDINYIAITGVLDAIGRSGQAPAPPLNLVGDFGGGALYLAVGLLAALLSARQTGRGQVVDAAIVDGAAHLMTMFHGLLAAGLYEPRRGANVVDSGAFFYDVYECADGRHISIGAIEERFYRELLDRLGIDPASMPPREDRARWPEGRERLAAIFRSRGRDDWCRLLEGTDTCFAPVLSMAEAMNHPQLRARGTYVNVGGVAQPAPAPRFSETLTEQPAPPPEWPAPAEDVLGSWLIPEAVTRLRAAGTLT